MRLARTLDRPMRYFLAKRQEGPALFVADRIDTLHQALAAEGLADQFHPSYTRMVPAHHVVELRLVGCPDPDPDVHAVLHARRATCCRRTSTRSAAATSARSPARCASGSRASSGRGHGEPIGVAFSGGIDSGAVFLVTYHAMRRARAVAGAAQGVHAQPRRRAATWIRRARSSTRSGLAMFLEEIAADPADLDLDETLRALEDYKPLDVECAAHGPAALRAASASAIRSGAT